LSQPIASLAKALARLTSPVHRGRMTDRPVAPSILRESNLLDALREGERAISRGEFLTHSQMIADVVRWKQSRRAAR
jgi:predicted transcriptional regulator